MDARDFNLSALRCGRAGAGAGVRDRRLSLVGVTVLRCPSTFPGGGVLLPSDVSELLVHIPLAQRGSSSRLALSSVVAVVRARVLRAMEHARDFVEDPAVLVIVWAELLLCDHTPASVLYPHRVGLLSELVHLLLLAQLLERDIDERRVPVLRNPDDV